MRVRSIHAPVRTTWGQGRLDQHPMTASNPLHQHGCSVSILGEERRDASETSSVSASRLSRKTEQLHGGAYLRTDMCMHMYMDVCIDVCIDV